MYVIVKKTKRGLEIGHVQYDTEMKANERAAQLNEMGMNVKVMRTKEALGL